MSELTDLVTKQNKESYQLGKKHGAIEELEQIKAEIDLQQEYFTGFSLGFNICKGIIQNHIAKLKGENK